VSDVPYICVTCGVQQSPGASLPEHCPICEDERQYVRQSGQAWTTLDELATQGHRVELRELEPGLTGVGAQPAVGIGQRALLVRADGGNFLWDCFGFIDAKSVAAIRAMGGTCTPTSVEAPPTASPTSFVASHPPTISPAPSSSPAHGTFSMSTEREMNFFAADRGSLIAFSTKETTSPYSSKIQRAEAPNGPWKTVYEVDASLTGGGQVVAGRVALVEYRAPYQGGGAYSEDFTVVDLSTGKTTAIDRFALSSATYRGGGGAPRRPVGRMVLGPDRVAWTRLVEGPGGSVTGELRVATLADPANPKIVGTSAEWISPLSVDAHRLLYVLGTKSEDQLHLLDLDTGTDRVIAKAAMPADIQVTPVPGLDRALLSGDWAIWLDSPRATDGSLRAVNTVSGAERTIAMGGSSCTEPSIGTRYVAWYCAAGVVGILDPKTLEPVATKPTGVGVAPIASDDALLWFDLSTNLRNVVLYRPQ